METFDSNGVIVIDPLTSVETADKAWQLYHRHRPQRKIVAMIYTHSHADPFGGSRKFIPLYLPLFESFEHLNYVEVWCFFGSIWAMANLKNLEAIVDASGHPHLPIYAPDGFLSHAVSENVYAVTAMSRRAV